jgi:DNA-binding Lrp family transcriptional regulator
LHKQQKCDCIHGSTLCDNIHNEIAKSIEWGENSQLMVKIDDINARILRELHADGRISNLTLADKVGLSPSACLRRVQELEKSGVIQGYRARLDPAQTGRAYVVYVAVGLSEHTKHAQVGFERAMQNADEVTECHNVAGAFEYMLRVEVADLPAYKVFHTERLGTVPHVRSITSYMVMGSPKDVRG